MTSYTTNPEQKIEVYKIAVLMNEAGLSSAFISDAVEVAREYEGAFELMKLWVEEKSQRERDEIIADLQDEIDRLKEAPQQPFRAPRINFDELDRNAEQVLKFKLELRQLVDRWGGIAQLARETGMPQPSLSRFFKSASFPRNTTIYRIVHALMPKDATSSLNWSAPYSIEQITALIWNKQNGANN